jgi:hypothetical protein
MPPTVSRIASRMAWAADSSDMLMAISIRLHIDEKRLCS